MKKKTTSLGMKLVAFLAMLMLFCIPVSAGVKETAGEYAKRSKRRCKLACESTQYGTIRMASVTDKSQCHKCQGQKPESTMCLHKHKIGGK